MFRWEPTASFQFCGGKHRWLDASAGIFLPLKDYGCWLLEARFKPLFEKSFWHIWGVVFSSQGQQKSLVVRRFSEKKKSLEGIKACRNAHQTHSYTKILSLVQMHPQEWFKATKHLGRKTQKEINVKTTQTNQRLKKINTAHSKKSPRNTKMLFLKNTNKKNSFKKKKKNSPIYNIHIYHIFITFFAWELFHRSVGAFGPCVGLSQNGRTSVDGSIFPKWPKVGGFFTHSGLTHSGFTSSGSHLTQSHLWLTATWWCFRSFS